MSIFNKNKNGAKNVNWIDMGRKALGIAVFVKFILEPIMEKIDKQEQEKMLEEKIKKAVDERLKK